MMETRSKRRRLISISSNVISWHDVPARFESLNDDTLTTVLEFVGKKSYRSFGGLNKHCKEIYLNTPGMTKETFLYGYAPLSVFQDRYDDGQDRYDDGTSVEARGALSKGVVFFNRLDVLERSLREEKKRNLLREICYVAVEEERFDLLNKVWNNLDHEDEFDKDVFEEMDEYAAGCGKLNMLKWVENKVPEIYKDICANEAARYGHLHIIEWLREEQDLELDGVLYDCAIEGGGQLHVLEWLREKEVDWYIWTFTTAAQIGNLDILQWLQDERCPWPDDDRYRVREYRLKPEVIDWCRVNGYGDRIVF